ncbi:MAG: PA14 domain-containing protein [Acidovorax sp.]
MAMELLRAAERADLCTAANAKGVGLRGEYFSDTLMRGTPKLVRVDEVVDFDQSIRESSGPATPPISSVRWSGWIKAPLTGAYRFHADAPNMRITVAKKIVAGVGAAPEQRFDMAAGRFYPIEIVVTQLTPSDARIRLEWTAPHGARYVVPRALLFLPTETVAAPKA